MESVILNIVIASCIISTLFVLTRVYFVYFAKRQCSDSCECDSQKDLTDTIVTAKIKPKRTAKLKTTSAASTKTVAKKKPGRKSKSVN